MTETNELQEVVKLLRRVAARTYDLFFAAGVGTHAHALIEVNGLISKYIDICERAANQGIDFRNANDHSGHSLPVEEHDLQYLAEKLRCMFGPMLDANPKAKAAFLETLAGDEAAPLMDYPAFRAADAEFHRAWTEAVDKPGYDKEEWKRRQQRHEQQWRERWRRDVEAQ